MLRVVSYNIENGKKLEEVMDWVMNLKPKPEIVCMQEFPKDRLNDLERMLKPMKEYGFRYAAAFTKKKQTFGQLTMFNVKKTPIVNFSRVALGVTRLEKVISRHDGKKAALVTCHKDNENIFFVVNLHLGTYTLNRFRQKQLKVLLDSVKDITYPIILLGDYNFSNIFGGKGWKKLMEVNGFTRIKFKMNTHKLIGLVPQQLDYVFVKNCTMKFFEVERNVKFSDHFPVISGIEGV